MQKFSGEGTSPPQIPYPLGVYGASIFAPTALKLNVRHPPKNPSCGLGFSTQHLTGTVTMARVAINKSINRELFGELYNFNGVFYT